MKLRKNSLLIGILFLILTACGSDIENTEVETQTYSILSDYNDGMKFIVDNFELEYDLNTSVPNYIKEYDVMNISKDITLALNASGQIEYLGFDHLLKEKAELILRNVGLNVNDSEDLKLLLDDPDSFHETHGVSYLTYDVDDFYFHIVGVRSDTLEAMNREEPYTLNIFYNDNVFENFMNE